MPRNRLLGALLLFASACLTVTPLAALAQAVGVAAPPPEQYSVSPTGVDMRSGRYAIRETDLAAGGGGEAGLTFRRIEALMLPGKPQPFANMSHNWDIVLTERRWSLQTAVPVSTAESSFQAYVSIEGRTESFESLGLTFPYVQMSRTPTSRLSHTGTRGGGVEVYTYVAPNGTEILFRPLPLIGASDCSTTIRCAFASSVTYPDGTKIDLTYDTRTSGNRARLLKVKSNRGYALLFEYGSSDWNAITKACIYNLAASQLPTSNMCDGNALASTSYGYSSFGGSPRLATAQDAAAKTWSYSYSAGTIGTKSYEKMSFTRPSEANAWLTNWMAPQKNSFAVDEAVTWRQDFSDGTSTTYNFNFSPRDLAHPNGGAALAGGSFTDTLGKTTVVQFDFPAIPYSMDLSDPSLGYGLIIMKYYGNNGMTWAQAHHVPTMPDPYNPDPDPNADPNSIPDPQFSIQQLSLESQSVFRDMMANLELQALAQCYECSGPGHQKFRVAYQITPGPAYIIDPLGRITSYDYCDPDFRVLPEFGMYNCMVGLLRSWTGPDGVTTTYKYSGSRITEARQIAKLGSGLADIVSTATYPLCTTLKVCQQPLTVTDANSNTTTYTYDPAHGGVLTEVGPAVNGVSPAKKYAYVQRTAWIKNAGSGYSAETNPVWLLSEERSCNTSALDLTAGTCAAGAGDVVVVSYDYGPNVGPNNLLLRSKAVTADGQTLRTCYSYDATGNVISETSPRGACS